MACCFLKAQRDQENGTLHTKLLPDEDIEQNPSSASSSQMEPRVSPRTSPRLSAHTITSALPKIPRPSVRTPRLMFPGHKAMNKQRKVTIDNTAGKSPEEATIDCPSSDEGNDHKLQNSRSSLFRMRSLMQKKVPHGLRGSISSSPDVQIPTGNKSGREIEWEPEEDWGDIDPFTENLVINCRTKELPTEVLQNLWFNDGGEPSAALLKGFTYQVHRRHSMSGRDSVTVKLSNAHGETEDAEQDAALEGGDVARTTTNANGHVDSSRGDCEYARLITINWWFSALLTTMIQAAVILADMLSNIIFAVSVSKPSEVSDTSRGVNVLSTEFKILFLALFVGLDFNQIRICRKLANDDVAILKRSGDWVPSREFDQWMAWFALVAFHFLNVPSTVKEIVRILHPMKAVQPYAALKCDGHRCYVVGYQSKAAYNVADNRGRDKTLPSFIWCKSVLTVFRLLVSWWTKDPVALATSLTGFGAVAIQSKMYVEILMSRQKHHVHLMRNMTEYRLPMDVALNKAFFDQADLPWKHKNLCQQAIKHFDADKIPIGEWSVSRQMEKQSIYQVIRLTVFLVSMALVFHYRARLLGSFVPF